VVISLPPVGLAVRYEGEAVVDLRAHGYDQLLSQTSLYFVLTRTFLLFARVLLFALMLSKVYYAAVAFAGIGLASAWSPAVETDFAAFKFNNSNTECAISCGKPGAIASNVVVSLSGVDAGCGIKKGGEFSLTSSYDLSADVTGGTAKYTASLNGLPVVNDKKDLCESLKDGPTPCPLKKGPVKSTTQVPLDEKVPTGTFVAQQTWTDTAGTEILCVRYQLKISN
jgi:hypothetical protein